MKTEGEATNAIETLNEAEWMGHTLIVQKAQNI